MSNYLVDYGRHPQRNDELQDCNIGAIIPFCPQVVFRLIAESRLYI